MHRASAMNAAVERLNRSVTYLEQSYASNLTTTASPASASAKKKSATVWEKERRACEEIRDVLSSWGLNSFQRLDLNRALELLFLNVDHRESAIRLIADQALDAIFRKFQLKFQLQRVIAILLTELSKNVYALHFMNSICVALARPEESVHNAIQQTFPLVFAHIGPYAGAHVEKAEELFRAALATLDLGGAANRAGCTVLAELCRYVPPILHKCFYRLSDIIFEANETEERTRLSGAMITFRLMWQTVVESLTEISLLTLRKIFCRVLCCLRSSSNEIVIAALELLGAVLNPSTPYAVLDFNPFRVEALERCVSAGGFSDASAGGISARRRSAVPPRKLSTPAADGNAAFVDPLNAKTSPESPLKDEVGAIENEMEMLGLDDLNNSLADTKSGWDSDINADVSLDFDGSVISEFAPIGRGTLQSRAMSQITTDDESSSCFGGTDAIDIVDPLLNCDNYLNADDELAAAGDAAAVTSSDDAATPTASRSQSNTPTSSMFCGGDATQHIPDELSADFCVGREDDINFCVYASLFVAQRFLLSGLVVAHGRALRDDRDIRVSHKILALKFLTAAVGRHDRVMANAVTRYDGQQFLSDAFGFIAHEDDGLAMAAANFLLAAEHAAVLCSGKSPQSAKILSLMRPLLRNRSAAQLKSILQAFTAYAGLVVLDEHLLLSACECAISTFDCDYFLMKIARAEFFAEIEWCRASAAGRRHLQPRCRDTFLRQLFDSDQRVVRATCAVLPKLVRNAEPNADFTQIFYTGISDWFAESGLCRIPMVLGLDSSKYSFRCEFGDYATESSLCHVLQALFTLAGENFHSRHSGLLAALSRLVEAFPPATHPDVWFVFARFLGNKTSTAAAGGHSPLSTRNSFLCLLLELANGGACLTLADLNALTQLIAAVFAGIAENTFVKALSDRSSHAKLMMMNSSSPMTNTTNRLAPNFPVDAHILEGVLIFYLRILNIFHTIVAEEKTRNISQINSSSATLLTRSGAAGITSPAAEKLSDLAKKITTTATGGSSGGGADSPKSSSRHSTTMTRQRLHNFAYLVGTGVRQNRPTSYFNSIALRNLEPTLIGAYRNFLESMKPELHARFVEPLESALNGFCAVVEMLNFDLVKTFLDEVLLYLRTIYDVSVRDSASCVHQLLKTIFHRNARYLNMKLLQSMHVKEPVPPNDPLEMYLTRSTNEFTVFTAFVSHADYMELFATRDAGWLAGGTLLAHRAGDLLQIADQLRAFDPFVTRLMQIYPLTNSVGIRLAVLDVLCTLLLNDVRYEMIDTEKKFYGRVTAQIRQLSVDEDVPLLGALFSFLVALSRVGYLTFAEVVAHLSTALTRVEESNAIRILEAVHIVLLESRRLIAETGATAMSEDAKSNAQREIRAFLCREFDFLFAHCPRAVSHLWILLLDSARKAVNSDWWSEISLEFLTRYEKFVGKRRLTAARQKFATSGQNSGASFDVSVDRPSSDFIALAVIFSCCDASAFRPIDRFYNCMKSIFEQLKEPIHTTPELPSSPLNKSTAAKTCSAGWLASREIIVLETVTKVLPLVFVTLCRLDEAVVQLRLNNYAIAGTNEEESVIDTGNENHQQQLDHDIVAALLALTRCLRSSDVHGLMQYGMAAESALVFLIQIVIYTVHAKKAPVTVSALQRLLRAIFETKDCADDVLEGATDATRLIAEVALLFPRAHAFWFALLAALDVRCAVDSFYFRDSYLGHTKLLICALLAEKMGTRLRDSAAGGGGDDFFAGRFLRAASGEFCARLLKWSEDPAMAAKKLPPAAWAVLAPKSASDFAAKLTRFLAANRADQLLPRYEEILRILRQHEDHDDGTEMSPAERVYRAKCRILGHSPAHVSVSETSNSNANSIVENKDQQFYTAKAASAKSIDDFRQIIAFLHVPRTNDAIQIIDSLNPQRRTRFFNVLFVQINRLCRVVAIEAHQNAVATNKNSAQALLDVVVAWLIRRDGSRIPRETVQLLAECAALPPDVCRLDEERLNGGDCVEHLFNDLIAYLIPRWQRLDSSDRRRWSIDVESAGERRDEILQIFEVVQRIVRVFRADLLPSRWRDDANVALAFTAILRLPLFARMCVVPESALRQDWRLTMTARSATSTVVVPLVNIHMLADADVLADFVWRQSWLGWTTKSQFEEFWMSLFGVLSSTPTASSELASAAAAQTLYTQLQASCMAVEALTGLILSAIRHNSCGDSSTGTGGRYLIKHRRRRDNYLFLDTPLGRAASGAKFWLLSSPDVDISAGDSISQVFTHNLEHSKPMAPHPGATTWSDSATNYGIGQTSLDYLWTITGLTAREPTSTTDDSMPDSSMDGDDVRKKEMTNKMKPSVSRHLIERSTAPDTTSSLKALFDNYLHWCSGGLTILPIGLHGATLKSMALLSDLIDDVFMYQIMFEKLRALFSTGSGGATCLLDECDDGARGYAIYLLLKCAAVVEWKDLLNYSILPTSTNPGSPPPPSLNTEADLAKFLEAVALENGLRRCPATPSNSSATTTVALALSPQESNFVGYCTLHGILYLLQSLAIDCLGGFVEHLTDFIIEELHRLQRPADILTDCSSDTIEYHKLVWTVAFRIVEDALPINPSHKANFLKLVSTLFMDPRLPTWQKRLLADGMQALVVHSNSYSATFRQTALECFDTCQLRPQHLPFALAVYTTCFYRELNEGGEPAYDVNKSFNGDFQKLLNVFLFYSTSTERCDLLAPIIADLIRSAWAKERIIGNIFDLITPIGCTALKLPTTVASGRKLLFADSLRADTDEKSAASSKDLCADSAGNHRLIFSQFDRSLLRLLYEIVARLAASCQPSTLDLCWTFLLPKLVGVDVAEFAQFLAALIFCASSTEESVRCRAALLLDGDTVIVDDEEFAELAQFLLDRFIEAFQCVDSQKSTAQPRTRDALLAMLGRVCVIDPIFPTRRLFSAHSLGGPSDETSFSVDPHRVAAFSQTSFNR